MLACHEDFPIVRVSTSLHYPLPPQMQTQSGFQTRKLLAPMEHDGDDFCLVWLPADWRLTDQSEQSHPPMFHSVRSNKQCWQQAPARTRTRRKQGSRNL